LGIQRVILKGTIKSDKQLSELHDCISTNYRYFLTELKQAILDFCLFSRIKNKDNNNNNNKLTVLWNQQVQTTRTFPINKPDIKIRDNEKGTCVLIDVAISGDRSVIKKEAEKILKYKDLTIETQRMWNVKTKVIPVIIGATDTISKSFRKYVSNIPGKHEVKELQKTAILGTAHILRKVIM